MVSYPRPEDRRDDLIEGISDSTSKNYYHSCQVGPLLTHSHILRGGKGGSKLKPINVTPANAAAPGSPYRTGSSSSRTVMSSPDLSVPPPISHPPPHSATSKHRYHLAFPRFGLTVNMPSRPAMPLGLKPKGVRWPLGRPATLTKCLRSSHRLPAVHYVP